MNEPPDYTSYTLSGLAQALRSIDQAKYPERAKLLSEEYARRQNVSEGYGPEASPPQRPLILILTTIFGLIGIPVILAALALWLGLALLLFGWKPN